MFRRAAAGAFLLATLPGSALSQALYEPVRDPGAPAEISYSRYFTTDNLDRRITFYLGNEPDETTSLPLIVFILGSGAHSNFIKREGRVLDAHRSLREALVGRGRVLAVEKPGVDFLSQPLRNGTALGASEDFLREHTLDRWTEAVSAAIHAALALPQVALDRLLVAGHSEGSTTAFRVAATNPMVTHVAGLAGFTAPPLRCFMSDPHWGRQELGSLSDPQERIDHAVAAWRKILAEPNDYTKLFAGHSYRYWASVNSNSPLELLTVSNAEIYLAQGTAESECSVDDFKLLYAQLIERGREVVAELIEGADHGFAFPQNQSPDGWKEQMERIANWFLKNRPSGSVP